VAGGIGRGRDQEKTADIEPLRCAEALRNPAKDERN
jgi:hypothetical protein